MNTIPSCGRHRTTPRSAKSSLNAFLPQPNKRCQMASSNHTTEAQQMAHTLGIVVGAASCSEQVTDERVNSIAVKLRHLVSTTATDPTDADAPNEQFSKPGETAIRAGGHARA